MKNPKYKSHGVMSKSRMYHRHYIRQAHDEAPLGTFAP